jgi:molecular chaperone DnaK (HSP70)
MQYLFALGGILVVMSAVMAALGFRGREQIIGIDLGTTFSVVALRRGDTVSVLPDRITGKSLVPSVVHYFKNGSVIVGRDAHNMRAQYPLQTIFNAKRFIGRPMSEVQADADGHPYKVVGNVSDLNVSEANAGFSIPTHDGEDRWVSPIDVGAEVVRHIKQSVADYMGYDIHRAVICVPAKFTVRESMATQKAFEQAGFKVMRMLEEPTAAAVAYNLHKESGARHVLVYDLGGGTLDTSLLYMNGKAVSVLGVAGDDHLGGSDFDRAMRDLVTKKLASPEEDSMEAAASKDGLFQCDESNLLVLGEEAKIALTNSSVAAVRCLGPDGQVRKVSVTRDEFETVAASLFDRAMAPVDKVLEDQMMTVEHVNHVVLVGGASRMPKIRDMLRVKFGGVQRLHTEIDPDVTVAFGAANIVD